MKYNKMTGARIVMFFLVAFALVSAVDALSIRTVLYFNVNDDQEPSVFLNYPFDGDKFTSGYINLNWTTTDNLDSMLYCNISVNSNIIADNISVQSGIAANYSVVLVDGSYSWNVTCWDSSGNDNVSETWQFGIDTAAPKLNVTDNVTLEYVVDGLYLDYNATDPNLDMFFINDTSKFYIDPNTGLLVNSSVLPVGTYYLNVSVNDTFGQVNSTILEIVVQDTLAPWWVDVPVNESLEYLVDSLKVDFNASDYSSVDRYFVNDTSRFVMNWSTGLLQNASVLLPGTYYINVSVNDSYGNVNSIVYEVIVGDATEPSFELVAPDGSVINQTQKINISACVSENSTLTANVTWDSTWEDIVLAYNGTQWCYVYEWTNTSYVDDYIVNITATDKSGNKNSTLVNFTVVDVTQPLLYNSSVANGSVYNQTQLVNISINVTDPYWDNVDDVIVEITYPNGSKVNYTLIEQDDSGLYDDLLFNSTYEPGQYNFTIYANDTSGNLNTTEGYFIVDDVTSPLVEVISPNVGTTINQTQTINITVNVTDPYWDSVDEVMAEVRYPNGTKVNYTLTEQDDSGIFDNVTFGDTIVPGIYNITIYANDSYGNYNHTETTYFVVQDLISPAVAILTPLDDTIAGWAVLLRANATDLDLDSVWYEIRNGTLAGSVIETGLMNNIGGIDYNGTLYTNDTWPYNVLNLNSTNLTLVVYANDTSGNVANASTYWTLDNTNPNIQFVVPLETGIFVNSNFSLYIWLSNHLLNYTNVTIYNTTTTIQVNSTLVGSPTFTWQDLVDVDSLAEGNYTVEVYASDYVGNSRVKTSWFYVDRTAPNVTTENETGWVYPTPANDSYLNSQTHTFNFTCNESFPDQSWIVFNDLSNYSLAGSGIYNWWTRTLAEGTYTYTGYCNDTAGNLAYTETRTITIDLTEPSFELVAPDGSVINQTQKINISACVSENSTLTANVTWDSTWEDIVLVYNGTQWCYVYEWTNTSYVDDYIVNITATDKSGNKNSTLVNFTVVDVTSPLVEVISPTVGTTINQTQTINITVNVTDPYWDSVDEVIAEVRYPNGTKVNYTLTEQDDSGIFDNFTFGDTIVPGIYNITIYANDSYGNYNHTETTYFIVDDDKAPLIVDVPGNATLEYGVDHLSVDFNATDLQLDDYYLNDSRFSIDNNGILVNSTKLDLGIYYLNVSVNDTSGNVNFTTYKVVVVDTTPPYWVDIPSNATLRQGLDRLEVDFNASDSYNLSRYFINDTLRFVINWSTGKLENITSLPIGTYYINVSVNDTSGNVNSIIYRVGVINSSEPLVSLVSPPSGSLDANGEVKFKYRVDHTKNITSCSLYINSSTNATQFNVTTGVTQLIQVIGIPEGMISWYVNCTDTIGVSGTSAVWTVKIDYPPGATGGQLILNETIYDANGTSINATIELIDLGSGEVDVNATTGQIRNISAGYYNIQIKPINTLISNIIVYNYSVIENLTDIIDLDNFTETVYDFVDEFAIDTKITGYQYINLTKEANTGDLFVCDDWNFSLRRCDGRWQKVGNYEPGENYTYTYYGDTAGFVESNYTINLIDLGDYLIPNNQTRFQELGAIVSALLVPENHTVHNITVYNHNKLNTSNDLRIHDIDNQTGWLYNLLVDPSPLNFINGTLYKTANGTSLWKCYVYNYSDEICEQDLEYVQVISPGLPYRLFFDNTDPVYFEQPDDIAGIDSYIDENAADTNYGVSDELRIDDRTGRTKRVLIKWNITSLLPAGVIVDSAVMELYRFTGSGSIVTDIVRVVQGWNEAGVDWNNRPNHDNLVYNKTVVNSNGWYAWNITQMVREWYNGTYTDNGLYIKAQAENVGGVDNVQRFYSSDHIGNVSLRPRINITYTDIAGPAINLNYPGDNFGGNVSEVNFNWTATDNLDNLTCNLTINGVVNVSNINSTNGLATNYSVEGFNDGEYYWNVTCWDSSGIANTSETRKFVVDSLRPNVTLNMPLDNSTVNINSIDFNCSVSDNIEVGNVTLYWDYGGLWSAAGTQYVSAANVSVVFTKTGLANGIINWNCLAYDLAGNHDWGDANYSATVNVAAKGDDEGEPDPYPIKPCVSDWECTAWGECVGGVETRECYDKNKCRIYARKPALAQRCFVDEMDTIDSVKVKPMLEIDVIESPDYADLAKEEFDVQVRIKNIGEVELNNIEAYGVVSIGDISGPIIIDGLKAGEEKEAVFTVYYDICKKDMLDRYYVNENFSISFIAVTDEYFGEENISFGWGGDSLIALTDSKEYVEDDNMTICIVKNNLQDSLKDQVEFEVGVYDKEKNAYIADFLSPYSVRDNSVFIASKSYKLKWVPEVKDYEVRVTMYEKGRLFEENYSTGRANNSVYLDRTGYEMAWLAENDSKNFVIGEKDYLLTIVDIGKSVGFESSDDIFNVSQKEIKPVDLDKDGIEDITIYLVKIENDKVLVGFKKEIEEPVVMYAPKGFLEVFIQALFKQAFGIVQTAVDIILIIVSPLRINYF